MEQVVFSPDSRLLLTGSQDGTMNLWNIADLSGLTRARALRNSESSSFFSPDGKILATVGANLVSVSATKMTFDGTAQFWDVATGKELDWLKGHGEGVHAASFSPDGKSLAMLRGGRTVNVWDLATHQESSALTSSTDEFFVFFSPDSKHFVTAAPETIRFWDLAQRELVSTVHRPPGIRAVVTFSHDEKMLASVAGNEVWLLDRRTRRELRVLKDKVWALNVIFSPDGNKLAAGYYDGTIRLRNLATGAEQALKGHASSVNGIVFSPDSRILASISSDGLRLWKTETGQLLVFLSSEGIEINTIAFSPDGHTLALGRSNGTVNLWRAATEAEVAAQRNR